MLLPLFAACTKTSHLFTIHPLRYYFFFSTLFIPSTWQYQFWCIPVEGLAAISGFTCAPINQPALDAYLLFMTVAATKSNYLTVYSFQLFITPLFVQFWCIPVEGLPSISIFTCAPHKPTSARCRPAIYDCSSYNAKLPNCL